MNLKAIAAVGLVAIGAGAVAISILGVGSPTSTATTYRTSTAAITTVQQTAAASGNLVAATVASLAFGEDAVIASGTSSASTATSGTSTGSTTSTGASAGASTTGSGTSVTVTWPVTAVEVAVGDIVAEGDVLATADTTTAELAVREAEANLAAARKHHFRSPQADHIHGVADCLRSGGAGCRNGVVVTLDLELHGHLCRGNVRQGL